MTDKDFIGELGPLALASRLRRLLSRLQSDGERVYQSLNIDFRVKWFPVLNLLTNHTAMGITEIARALHMAHPSVIEVTEELIREGLIDSRKCESDGRRREVAMTAKGKRMCAELEPVWQAFGKAGEEVIRESDNDFLESIKRIETAMDRRSMYDRIMARLEKQE